MLRALAIALLVGITIGACEDRFRYPCQDNKNWNKPECQRPTCAVTGTCPDQLVPAADFKPEGEK
jgi:hypothetical protein